MQERKDEAALDDANEVVIFLTKTVELWLFVGLMVALADSNILALVRKLSENTLAKMESTPFNYASEKCLLKCFLCGYFKIDRNLIRI